MNCSKKVRIRIHKIGIKIFTALNIISLLFWVSLIDCIISWQPYVIMLFNFVWICIVLWAYGLVYDTKPYYERLEKEGDYYDEM